MRQTGGSQRARVARAALALLYLAPGCGGLVAGAGAPSDSGATQATPSAGRDAAPSGAPDASDAGLDASDAGPDASRAACECTHELTQVAGTCEFAVEDRRIACVLDRTGGASIELDLFRSCIQEPPPSWTPGLSPTRIEQCNCTPGEVRRLCVAYR